jgi:hypothetical protein
MDSGAQIQTNMMTLSFWYGINGCDVNSGNDENNLHLKTNLKN